MHRERGTSSKFQSMFWIGATVRPELDTAPEIMSRIDSPEGYLGFLGFHSTLNVFPLSYETKL